MSRPWENFFGSKLYPWMAHGWTMHGHAWESMGSHYGPHISLVTLPRFSIFANLCRSAEFFCRVLHRSLHWILKIHTDLQDLYISVQIFFKDFCRIVFLQLLRNQYTAFLDFFKYFIKYFSWPRFSQLILSIARNSRERNFVPITVILVNGECAVLVVHRNLSISLELSRSDCWTLRGSFAILTSFWRMKFDMWQPSGLVDVLIKCCCNRSGTWFVGVILVICGDSEYVIVIYWPLFGSVKSTILNMHRQKMNVGTVFRSHRKDCKDHI